MQVQSKLKSNNIKFINLLKINDYYITSDKKRLKQILINIIGNAIKFTNQGQIKVIIDQAK